MANNTDKEMRGKLQGFEAPMDPAAWQQMEAMLNKKKKRRPLLWWWTGGSVAAVLLLGVWLYLTTNTKPQGKQIAKNNKQIIEQTTAISTTEQKQPNKQMRIAQETLKEKQAAEQQKIQLNPTDHQRAVKRNKPNRKQKRNNAVLAPVTSEESATFTYTAEPFSAYIVGDKAALQSRLEETALLQQVRAQGTSATIEEEATVPSRVTLADSLHKETEVTAPISITEKVPVFNYQLGVAANVTATSVGAQNINGKNNLVYTKPTFAVGITQEFLFQKRFAITTGLLYAQTSYHIERPITDSAFSGSNTYNHYIAQLQELNIPVGIKVYAYNTKALRVSVHTGIINHIKLNEKFVSNITSEPNALVNVPPVTLFDNTTVTNSNPFGAIESNMVSDLQKSVVNGEADYFGIRGQRRYYTSFYVSCGVEVVLRKRLHLVAEPMYQLLLHSIGRQPNLKHNFGISAGVKYTFGK